MACKECEEEIQRRLFSQTKKFDYKYMRIVDTPVEGDDRRHSDAFVKFNWVIDVIGGK